MEKTSLWQPEWFSSSKGLAEWAALGFPKEALNISAKPCLGRLLDVACQHRSYSIWVSCNNSSPFLVQPYSTKKLPSLLLSCIQQLKHIATAPLENISWHTLSFSSNYFLFQLFGTVVTWENGGLTTVLLLKYSVNEHIYPYNREYSGFHTTGRLFTGWFWVFLGFFKSLLLTHPGVSDQMLMVLPGCE